MAKKTCPHCGALVDSNRLTCPNCRADIREKSSLTLYLVIAGIIGAIILVVVALLFILPAMKPVTVPQTPVPAPPTLAAVQAPAPPSCSIAITGRKSSSQSIQLQVMTTTCSASEVKELRVLVNGEKKGTLGSGPGSSGTFAGTSGTNTVVVTAKYSNGAESVVYQSAAL